jgi:broad specificity phosphatase PhoE
MFIGRAAHMLKRLSERPESRILIFTHGQFISAALWLAMTRPSVIDSDAMRRFYSFIHGYAVPNCSVLPLYFFPDGSIAIGPLVPPAGVVVTGSGLAGL